MRNIYFQNTGVESVDCKLRVLKVIKTSQAYKLMLKVLINPIECRGGDTCSKKSAKATKRENASLRVTKTTSAASKITYTVATITRNFSQCNHRAYMIPHSQNTVTWMFPALHILICTDQKLQSCKKRPATRKTAPTTGTLVENATNPNSSAIVVSSWYQCLHKHFMNRENTWWQQNSDAVMPHKNFKVASGRKWEFNVRIT